MARKIINRWGVVWVLECMDFEEHIKRLIKERKKLEEDGYDDEKIKNILLLRCKYTYMDDILSILKEGDG